VDVSFVDSRLARECNSSVRLQARWGDGWSAVAKRLLQIAAAEHIDDLRLLPFAKVKSTQDRGTYDVEFSDGIIVRLVAMDGGESAISQPPGIQVQILSIYSAEVNAA
jgi:hypothetical protein